LKDRILPLGKENPAKTRRKETPLAAVLGIVNIEEKYFAR